MQSENGKHDVVIIGAGVAGLNCALELQKSGVSYTILEADSRVGGRIQTDEVDGFKLDRGFQVFQSAYPEAQRVLNYDDLQLIELEPGAKIRREGRWHCMSDPMRRPLQAWATLTNPIGRLSDRWNLLKLRSSLKKASVDELLLASGDMTTLRYLREQVGFSKDFIDSFMRPWLAGIFLESELDTSSNYFQFVFKMLSEPSICLPRGGMGRIPEQMLQQLDSARVRLNTPVERVGRERVNLKGGEEIEAPVVVIGSGMAAELLEEGDCKSSTTWNPTTCIYFAAESPPTQENCLMLNGVGQGAVNHVFISSNSDASLSPDTRSLVSVSLVGEQASAQPDMKQILDELTEWFGSQVHDWRHLKTYYIPHAVPSQQPGEFRHVNRQPLPGRFVCGDVTESASLNGALRSGRDTAHAVINFLS